MSIRLMTKVWDLDLPPFQKFVLLKLADNANDDGERCFPSQRRIARDTGISVRAVQEAIKGLKKSGIIEIGRQGGGRYSIQYTLKLEKGKEQAPFIPSSAGGDRNHPNKRRVAASAGVAAGAGVQEAQGRGAAAAHEPLYNHQIHNHHKRAAADAGVVEPSKEPSETDEPYSPIPSEDEPPLSAENADEPSTKDTNMTQRSGKVEHLRSVPTRTGTTMITFEIKGTLCKAFGRDAERISDLVKAGLPVSVAGHFVTFKGRTELNVQSVKTTSTQEASSDTSILPSESEVLFDTDNPFSLEDEPPLSAQSADQPSTPESPIKVIEPVVSEDSDTFSTFEEMEQQYLRTHPHHGKTPAAPDKEK